MTRMTEEEQEEQEEQDDADTPQEQEPRTDIDRQAPSAKRLPSAKRRQAPSDALVNGSLILAEFPSEVLVHLAEMLGNPLTLLVSKAHLSKAFREAARAAQATLTHIDIRNWKWTVDDAVVAAVISKCTQLSSLNLGGCYKITNATVLAVASGCEHLTSLNLGGCYEITNAAVVAVASGCMQLTTLDLLGCNITDAAVVAVASGCKQLATLDLYGCRNITDAAVVAVASGCKQLTTLYLMRNITDAAKANIPNTVRVL